MNPAHVVCFSGGEASAVAAIEVARKYGTDSLVLLNHDIHRASEDADIKRFKNDVAGFIGLPVTYANMKGWQTRDQFDVVVEAGAFKVGNGTALCTSRMKTEPFYAWLKENKIDETTTLYYGFEIKEKKRIQRRIGILGAAGYRTGYPLTWPTRTIHRIIEVGIVPPVSYQRFRHGNCVGCLKAGMQHWYIVYCLYPDTWERGLWAEEEIGYTIIKGHSLLSLESKFETMRRAGVPPTELLPAATFWKEARLLVGLYEEENEVLPCECSL